jgi:apolipoprotein N-acyltransferase
VDGLGVSGGTAIVHRWRWGLAVASGLLSAAAFPPWDIGWIAFIAWVPLLVCLRDARGREAAGLGYAAGLVFYLATIWWVINTMTTYGRMPLVLSLVALVLLCGILAGYTAAFAWLLAAGRERLGLPDGLLPVAAAALWTGLEFLRTYLFSGFPWALLGYTQYRQPTVRLLAAATGVYGISALVLLVNGAFAGMSTCLLRRGGESSRRRGVALHALVVGLVALGTLAYAWGLWRDVTGGPAIRVGLLQGNIDQSVKWDRRYQSRTLETYERLARLAAAERPSLVIWPETALPFFLRREPELGPRVRAFVAETRIPMLIGSPDAGEDGLLYNSAFFLGPDGAIRGRYDKRHLVPFGEYVPLQRVFFFLDKLVTGIGDFGRGRIATVFQGDGYRFSVMICYEVIFPAEVREFTQAGAEFLVNITNDAWFGRSGAPYQHLAMAAMRAVENGSYLVRAANTGVTAVIAPTGAILAQTPLFVETNIVGTIHPRVGETPYTRYGDVLAWGCMVFLAGYGVALLWSSMGRPRVAPREAQRGGTDDSGSRTEA